MKHTAENTPGLAWKAIHAEDENISGAMTEEEKQEYRLDQQDEAERGTPTGEFIDMTPVGCQTPEGTERVNVAMKAFTDAREEVARLATALCRNDTYTMMMRSVLEAQDEQEAIDYLDALSDAVETRLAAEDAFLRAVCGQPQRPEKPKLKTYPATINGKTVQVTIPEN